MPYTTNFEKNAGNIFKDNVSCLSQFKVQKREKKRKQEKGKAHGHRNKAGKESTDIISSAVLFLKG